MLRLIQTEFLKLRRRKLIWIMLLAALMMPFLAFLYFKYLGKTDVDPMEFYRWAAFGFTVFIILPVVLGILCTMLMYEETRYDTAKQLWIVPVSQMGYFFSKFFVALIYAVTFMLITAAATVLCGVPTGIIGFNWSSILFLLERCMELGGIISFAMLPILAVAACTKGYILPACLTIVYAFAGFILTPVNMYLHPLSSMLPILLRNKEMQGLTLTQDFRILPAVLCFCVWDLAAVVFVNVVLSRRK